MVKTTCRHCHTDGNDGSAQDAGPNKSFFSDSASVNFASAIATVQGRLSRQEMAAIIEKVVYKANLKD
jgi:hypothetical protein